MNMNKLPYLKEIENFDRDEFYSNSESSLQNCGCCDKEFYNAKNIDNDGSYLYETYCKKCADAYEDFDKKLNKAINSIGDDHFAHLFYKYMFNDSYDAFFEMYRWYINYD